MIPNLFLLSATGEILLEKHWIGSNIKRNVIEIFWEISTQMLNNSTTSNNKNRAEIPSIITTPKYYFISTFRSSITLLTIFTTEQQPLLIGEFHQSIITIFIDYFNELNETTIRENFSIALQLLDEIIDGGFPSCTELNQLREMILPPTLSRKLLQSVTSNEFAVRQDLPSIAISKIPWRKSDVKYVTNEIYFDCIEQIDCIINANQQIIVSNVYGEMRCNCRLSGMPDLTLSFTKSNLLDDISLHRCVRINRYQREKVISFVPPDGQFTLFTYRIGGNLQMPIYVKPQINYHQGVGKVHVMVS